MRHQKKNSEKIKINNKWQSLLLHSTKNSNHLYMPTSQAVRWPTTQTKSHPPPHNEPRVDKHVPPQQRLVQHHQNNHQHLNRPNQPQLPPPLTSLVHRPQNKDTTLQPNNPDDQYYVEKLLRYKSRDGKKFFSRKMAWSQWTDMGTWGKPASNYG